MKEKIKKFGLLSIIVLVLISVVGFSYYKYHEEQEQKRLLTETQEQNYLFAKDVIYSLIQINRAFRQERVEDVLREDSELQFLQEVYGTKEKLLDAKNVMDQWSDNKNIQINKVANDMLQGIDDLLVSTEASIRLATKESTAIKQDLAIFKVKLDQGREKIMVAPINIGLEFSLSDSQKRELISYIETNFEDEVKRRNEQIEKGEEPTMPAEAVAAFLIKGGLEGIGADWDKVKEEF